MGAGFSTCSSNTRHSTHGLEGTGFFILLSSRNARDNSSHILDSSSYTYLIQAYINPLFSYLLPFFPSTRLHQNVENVHRASLRRVIYVVSCVYVMRGKTKIGLDMYCLLPLHKDCNSKYETTERFTTLSMP